MQNSTDIKSHYAQIRSQFKGFRWQIVLMGIVISFSIILSTGMALLLQQVVNSAINVEIQSLLRDILVVFILLISFLVIQTILNIWMNAIVIKGISILRVFLYNKILKKNSISNYSSGELLSRAYVEPPAINQYLVIGRMRFITQPFAILVYLSILAYFSWIIAAVVAIAIPLFFLLLHTFNKRLAVASNQVNAKSSLSQNVFLGMYKGFSTLKIFGREAYNADIFCKTVKKTQTKLVEQSRHNAYFQTMLTVFRQSFPVIMAALTAFLFSKKMVDDIGVVMLVYMLVGYMISPMDNLATNFQMRTLCNKAYERIAPLFVEEATNFGDVRLGAISELDIKIGEFGYGEDKTILSDFAIKIGEGTSLCIVGESGSGKSSLLKLILNQYKLDNGYIKVNGVDIGQVDKDDYYKQIGYLQQASFMFESSIIENICLGETFDTKDIDKAIADSGLSEFVKEYGLHKAIDEKNENMSGGQLQRLSLARVMVRKPRLLLLDEPTAALDEETTKEVMHRVIKYVKDNRLMMICVSHDNNVIEMFGDNVVAM